MRAGAAVLGAALLALVPRSAAAFCGFYVSGADAKLTNDASMVVLLRDGTRTVLSMQNDYQGPPADFAMVVPVPVILQKENVKTLSKDVFDHLETLGAPRLVEYWEQDPCFEEESYADSKEGGTGTRAKGEEGSMGSGNRFASSVTVEAKFAVGEYEIVILSAKDAVGLDGWLREEHYKIPAGADAVLRPYVVSGSKFFVAKVDVKKVRFEGKHLRLSPLRFHYDSEQFALPVRLGLLNSSGTQDIIVQILAKQRYEVANYANVTIPTNIDVDDAVRTGFPAFYAALFDRTIEKNPKAVVTEYAWQANSCDPCPGPPVSESDVRVLGGDTLPKLDAMGLTLTRLHARYTKDSLGEDLVFRAAPPIVGGREGDASGPASENNFQARYVIRHKWTGPIRCANPERGMWGGPPTGVSKRPAAAKDLATAPRGGTSLEDLVQRDVPELGVTASAAAETAPARRVFKGLGLGALLGVLFALAYLESGRGKRSHG
jgi:hypothetical protein